MSSTRLKFAQKKDEKDIHQLPLSGFIMDDNFFHVFILFYTLQIFYNEVIVFL